MLADKNPDVATRHETWENEGGAAPSPPGTAEPSMTGTVSQVEWAQRIRRNVDAYFSRTAATFQVIANGQNRDERADTEAIIAILEDKRAEVMARPQAGYFIRNWQEIKDQIRRLIFHDHRYQDIKSKRPPRPGS